MVEVKIGDIFKSEAQTLVNTVNCVGIMGKGLALEFKKRGIIFYPRRSPFTLLPVGSF